MRRAITILGWMLMAMLSALLPNGAFAQVGDTLSGQTAIFTLLDPATKDLGEVPTRKNYEFSWRFRNDGDIPLQLSSVKCSCGCCGANWDRNPVMPGDTSEIEVFFHSANRIGNQIKTLSVRGNFAEAPTLLTFKLVLVPMPEIYELDFPENRDDE